MRYYNGNFITKNDNQPTAGSASGIFNLEAQLIHKAQLRWPLLFFTDPTQGFVECSRRFIDSGAYMGNSSDYDGNYDVSDVNVPSSFTGSARIYLGHKNTAGSALFGDIAIACIQILNSTGTSLLKSWNWSGNTNQGWENKQTQTEVSGVENGGYPESLQTAATATYGSSITTSSVYTRFSLASGTGTAFTGAADGISADYSEDGVDSGIGTILPSPGDAVVAQVSGTSYIYRETSGSTRFTGVTCRSPAYTFSGSEIIRIAHCLPGRSNYEMDPDDTLYIGIA